MLSELRIRDLGIIAEIDLVLGPGMTALTGETGAGKTMLVEAIGLLLGAPADTSMVRQGAAEARIEGLRIVPDGADIVHGAGYGEAARRAQGCNRGDRGAFP